jgi:serine phosphatase RsbU (regulator of sigma subunit)
VSGILEPAYSIGGDSFDYAVNLDRLEFGIVDAVGHGMPAVLLSVVAINCLRNARREGYGLSAAYLAAGEALATQFGDGAFVTGQIGSLALDSGELSWVNAGHPLPLLIRDGTFQGEVPCLPSLPMGLGGTVKQVAVTRLQPGDRVLFFTDGVIESRSPAGREFGRTRLADHFLRATSGGVGAAETVRRLAAEVVVYNGAPLNDDATMLLVDYQGARGPGH